MDNIYRGEPVSRQDFLNRLSQLPSRLQEDLLLEPLTPGVVIEAVDKLLKALSQQEITKELMELGVPKYAAEEYVRITFSSLEKQELFKKVYRELGENPFTWKTTEEDIEEKDQPLGVLLHIGAGNALGISAFSVLEGLLTGNINILKLPENEGGLSSKILLHLAEIEPRLMPYIYVLDVSSKDKEIISALIEAVDAVVVWGSDDAVTAIRQLTPPTVSIIEWGHRLSFAYFSKKEDNEEDLQGLARDICSTDQLYCSSPQCVFYETTDHQELDKFAYKLAKHIESTTKEYPVALKPEAAQAQITWIRQLVSLEEVLEEKKLIIDEDRQYSVMIDYHAELKTSPLFRNIWVMPIERRKLMGILRAHKGHLQTLGLSCNKEEFDELANIFYAAGVNRITSCGHMSVNYSGEPHDGYYAMGRYVRRVNRKIVL